MQGLTTKGWWLHRWRLLLGLGNAVIDQVISNWLDAVFLRIPAGTSPRQWGFGIAEGHVLGLPLTNVNNLTEIFILVFLH